MDRRLVAIRASDIAPRRFSYGDWSGWQLDAHARVLSIQPGGRWGRYEYPVLLDECTTAARVLDAVAQVSRKTWCTPAIRSGLVCALDEVLELQASLCGGGHARDLDRATIARLVTEHHRSRRD